MSLCAPGTARFALLAVAIISAMSCIGCSSLLGIGEAQFTCEKLRGHPISDPAAAAVCGGVKAVYKETNSKGALPNPRDLKTTDPIAVTSSVSATSASAGSQSTTAPTRVVFVPTPLAQPKPIMEPAQVARVWINYWIDSRGDLHQPGLLYTEITPRRWAVGQPGSPAIRELQPFQVMRDGEEGAPTQQPSGAAVKAGVEPSKQRTLSSTLSNGAAAVFPMLNR